MFDASDESLEQCRAGMDDETAMTTAARRTHATSHFFGPWNSVAQSVRREAP